MAYRDGSAASPPLQMQGGLDSLSSNGSWSSSTQPADFLNLLSKLDIEHKVRDGAENLLRLLQAEGDPSKAELRRQVEGELVNAQNKIASLQSTIDQQRPYIEQQPSYTEDNSASPDSSARAAASDDFDISSSGGLGIIGVDSSLPIEEETHQTREKTRVALGQAEALFSMLESLGEVEEEEPADSSAPSARRLRKVPGHIRTPSNAAGLGRKAKQSIDTMVRIVGLLRSNARIRYELPASVIVNAVMHCLSDAAGKEIRAHAYRTLRHAIVRPPRALCEACRDRGLHFYLQRTFLRDHRFDQEREQALKLVRAIMEAASGLFGSSPVDAALQDFLDIGVIRSLVAIAEHHEDKLRTISLETLGELAVIDIALLVRAGGLSPLLRSVTESNADLSPSLIRTVISLLDLPSTRAFLRPGVDLDVSRKHRSAMPTTNHATVFRSPSRDSRTHHFRPTAAQRPGYVRRPASFQPC